MQAEAGPCMQKFWKSSSQSVLEFPCNVAPESRLMENYFLLEIVMQVTHII